MTNPSRPELGSEVAVVPRPLVTMRAWLFSAGIVVALFALSSNTTISETVGAAVLIVAFLLVLRTRSATRVFELGLESGGTRMRWDKIVAYRLSLGFGSQKIMLIEQTTTRELPMFLNVFQSDAFRDAVGDRANLSVLVKAGLP